MKPIASTGLLSERNPLHHLPSLDSLSDDAQIPMQNLASSAAKGYYGYLMLSPSTIYRLEKQGKFPQALRHPYSNRRYYLAGEIKAWLKACNEQALRQREGGK